MRLNLVTAHHGSWEVGCSTRLSEESDGDTAQELTEQLLSSRSCVTVLDVVGVADDAVDQLLAVDSSVDHGDGVSRGKLDGKAFGVAVDDGGRDDRWVVLVRKGDAGCIRVASELAQPTEP